MVDVKLVAERAKRTFIKLADRLDDLSPIWASFIGYWHSELMPGVWNTRGAMMGERWQEYTKNATRKNKDGSQTTYSRYLLWKQRKYPGQPMMKLTNKLYEAATGGEGWFQKIEKKNLTIGIEGINYSLAHQNGYPQNNLPARPYFYNQHGEMQPRSWKYLIDLVNKSLEGADDDR